MATSFAPKFLGILGALFDTPANDAMAATQGQHFAEYFRQGAIDYMRENPIAPEMVGKIR
jgi:hypothetical protein